MWLKIFGKSWKFFVKIKMLLWKWNFFVIFENFCKMYTLFVILSIFGMGDKIRIFIIMYLVSYKIESIIISTSLFHKYWILRNFCVIYARTKNLAKNACVILNVILLNNVLFLIFDVLDNVTVISGLVSEEDIIFVLIFFYVLIFCVKNMRFGICFKN